MPACCQSRPKSQLCNPEGAQVGGAEGGRGLALPYNLSILVLSRALLCHPRLPMRSPCRLMVHRATMAVLHRSFGRFTGKGAHTSYTRVAYMFTMAK